MPPYQSYPPSLLKLPMRHDLKLVGTPQAGTLVVDFTWDSDGKAASIDFGDGATETTADEAATHTYAAHQVYTATVRSGQASDSADLDLSAATREPGLSGISPTSCTVGEPFTLTATGEDFTAESEIWVEGNTLPTDFVSATTLTAEVTANVAGTYAVSVHTGALVTNSRALMVNEAEPASESLTDPTEEA